MATKKTAKKVAKRVAKVKAKPTAYVVSVRSKLFVWTPVYYSHDRDEALAFKRAVEADSIYGVNAAKLTTVSPL